MACAEKVLLQGRYTKTTELFTEALIFLSTRISTIDKQEYERLRRVAEHFRKESDQARMDLEKHITVHGCWEDATAAGA
jgi:hypothetical protein